MTAVIYLKTVKNGVKHHSINHAKFNHYPNRLSYLRVPSKGLLKTLDKVEIASNEQFLLYPQYFSTREENVLPFSENLALSSANFFRLEGSKICHLRKG